jgi:hypothetical protein
MGSAQTTPSASGSPGKQAESPSDHLDVQKHSASTSERQSVDGYNSKQYDSRVRFDAAELSSEFEGQMGKRSCFASLIYFALLTLMEFAVAAAEIRILSASYQFFVIASAMIHAHDL